MASKWIGSGIGVTIVGVVVWAFFGVWYASVSMAKSGGWIAASAYGPSPSSYGISLYLLIVGIVVTGIGIGLAAAGLRQTRASVS